VGTATPRTPWPSTSRTREPASPPPTSCSGAGRPPWAATGSVSRWPAAWPRRRAAGCCWAAPPRRPSPCCCRSCPPGRSGIEAGQLGAGRLGRYPWGM